MMGARAGDETHTSRKGIFWQARAIIEQGGLGVARNRGYLARLPVLSRSSRGLGHQPFTLAARVRIPYGTPPPIPKTCSQPWVGLEIPEYLRAFRQKP